MRLKINTDYENNRYVLVKDLLSYIDDARDNGNLVGEKGFSAALFLSKLIKDLE